MLGADSLARSRAYQSLGFVHVFVRLSRSTRVVELVAGVRKTMDGYNNYGGGEEGHQHCHP